MARVRVSQHLVEVLVPTDTFSATEPTGAGVTQHLIEVLGAFPGKARVSGYVVEVLMSDDEDQSSPPSNGSAPVTRATGYAV